jgi:hypothetical protein
MIKKQIFTIALLITPTVAVLTAGLAYGQTPSASFTDQVVPAGSDPIACDIGPPYTGSIPAGAAAAGFTHCAVNLDFTQFTSLSQFIDCFGASSPLLWAADTSTVPCDSNHYAMVSDGGVNVFAATWLVNDTVINNLLSNSTVGQAFPAYLGYTVPNAQFVETTWRVNSDTQCTAGCLMWGPFEYPHSGDPYPFVEFDVDETYTSPNLAQGSIHTNLTGTILAPVFDPTNYHTYGARVTSDGNGDYALCEYFSSAVVSGLPASSFNTCLTTSTSGSQDTRKTMMVPWLVNNNDFSKFTASVTVYIQRLTIWECADWRGSNENSNIFIGNQCNGTLLTSAP